jgi:hypothetical protein
MPSRQGMTGWYDPRRLVAIGIRVAEAKAQRRGWLRNCTSAETVVA